MKKVLLFFAMAGAWCCANAATYYVDPNATKSGKGSSWEQAITVKDIIKAAGSLKDGDVIYMKGGTYTLNSVEDCFKITKSITVIGGFDPSATGTVTDFPTYPVATPTVISGDVNADGIPSDGDAQNVVYIDFSGDTTKVATIQGIDITNAYCNAMKGEGGVGVDRLAGALFLYRGNIWVKNCNIYNNATNFYGGAGCNIQGAFVQMTDCNIYGNKAISRGGGLRIDRAYVYPVPEDTAHYKVPSQVVLERCAVYNNEIDPTSSSSKYGGGIQITQGNLYAINSTIANNKAFSNGAGISAGDGYNIFLISCTLGNNTCSRIGLDASKPYSYGSSIRMEIGAYFKMMNTICVENDDDFSKTNPSFYTEKMPVNTSQQFTTGGYNLLGTFMFSPASKDDQFTNFWKSTDMVSTSAENVYLFDDIFGTPTNLKNNGGCTQTVMPLEMQNGASVADLTSTAQSWFPAWAKVDASLDQRGYIRNASITCRGAAGYEAEAPTAISEVGATLNTSAAMFDILGRPVSENYHGVVLQGGKKFIK